MIVTQQLATVGDTVAGNRRCNECFVSPLSNRTMLVNQAGCLNVFGVVEVGRGPLGEGSDEKSYRHEV